MILDKYEKALFYEIFIKKEYSILDNNIKEAKIIFDIWSHIWLFSLYCLNKKFDFDVNINNWEIIYNILPNNNNFIIHNFEPVSYLFNKSKIILDKFEDYIVFNQLGVSNSDYQQKIFLNKKISSQNSIYKSFFNSSDEFELCNFINIEKYLEYNNINNIDIMKIDIEWWEFDLLLNMNKNFYSKIKILFFEYHIINDSFNEKLDLILIELNRFFWEVKCYKWNYLNVGYVFCKNNFFMLI